MALKELRVVHTGRPAPFAVAAPAYIAATLAWLAASLALVAAVDDLVDGAATATDPVLVTHLVGVVFFPFAVVAAVWQLIPVMLRNDPPHPGRRPVVLALLLGGVPLAAGVAIDEGSVIAVGALALGAGLVLLVLELAAVVRNAPAGKTLAISRPPVVLAAAHAGLAFLLGAAIAGADDPSPLGVPYERLLLVHLSLALIGWLTVLIAVVGRTLVPMLGLAAAPAPRRAPLAELGIVAGLWVFVAGVALESDPAVAVGVIGTSASLAVTGRVFARTALTGRFGVREAPVAHVAIGLVLLAQAALLALGVAAGVVDARRGTIAAVVLLGLGWAVGVVLGHLGKLVSLSAWGSWPPGPRPKQAALYPRRLWQVEAALFAVAVEGVAAGVLVDVLPLAMFGAVLLVASAMVATVGVAISIRRGITGLRAAR